MAPPNLALLHSHGLARLSSALAGHMMHAARLVIAAAAIVIGVGGARAADILTKAPPTVAPVPWAEVWTGIDVQNDSIFGYMGGVVALNSHLDVDGWLFRVEGGDGRYSYVPSAGVKQSVDFESGSLMLGYQSYIGAARVTGYVGAYVQTDNNPDPLAAVTGTKWGVKGQGEAYVPLSQAWFGFLLASYASVWDTYDVLARIGYQTTPTVAFGPEAGALGSDRFGDARGGAFVSVNLSSWAQIVLSGGYSADTRENSLNDHSGGYGTIHFRAVF
jgi:hypothetical protein